MLKFLFKCDSECFRPNLTYRNTARLICKALRHVIQGGSGLRNEVILFNKQNP